MYRRATRWILLALEPGAPLRRDAGPPIPLSESLSHFAPDMRGGFFIVPRLATHEDDASEEDA